MLDTALELMDRPVASVWTATAERLPPKGLNLLVVVRPWCNAVVGAYLSDGDAFEVSDGEGFFSTMPVSDCSYWMIIPDPPLDAALEAVLEEIAQ